MKRIIAFFDLLYACWDDWRRPLRREDCTDGWEGTGSAVSAPKILSVDAGGGSRTVVVVHGSCGRTHTSVDTCVTCLSTNSGACDD